MLEENKKNGLCGFSNSTWMVIASAVLTAAGTITGFVAASAQAKEIASYKPNNNKE